MTNIETYIGMALGTIAIGSYFYTWLTARSKANTDKISEQHKNFVDLEKRVLMTEASVRHIESSLTVFSDATKRVHARLDDLSATTHKIDGKFDQVNRTLQLMHQHLLSGDSR